VSLATALAAAFYVAVVRRKRAAGVLAARD
jgi:hypothetical protein